MTSVQQRDSVSNKEDNEDVYFAERPITSLTERLKKVKQKSDVMFIQRILFSFISVHKLLIISIRVRYS